MVVATGNGVNANGAGSGVAVLDERPRHSVGTLTIYERMEPANAIKALASIIQGSGMFGVKGTKQAELMAWECLARKVPPSILLGTYHVIHGKLSIKSEKMVSNFNEAGGEHQIVTRTSEEATVRLIWKGHATEFSYTWEQCQQEPHAYNNKEEEAVNLLNSTNANDKKKLKLKPKYATPHSRMQMLWWRVISDAIRVVYPKACEGCYTEQEVRDFTNDDGDMQYAMFPETGTVAAEFSQGEVIDGEFEVTSDAEPGAPEIAGDSHGTGDEPTLAASAEGAGGEGTAASQAEPQPAAPEYCTAEQSQQITGLIAKLGMTSEQIERALAKRGAHNNRSLKFDVAEAYIKTLQEALARKQFEAAAKGEAEAEVQAVETTIAEAVGESREQPIEPGEAAKVNGPATQQQCDEARALIGELNQLQPGIANRFKAHMQSKGLKIADLSAGECAVLLQGLQKKKLEVFFDLSLTGWKPKGEPAVSAELQTASDAVVATKTAAECTETYQRVAVTVSRSQEDAEALLAVYSKRLSELDGIPF